MCQSIDIGDRELTSIGQLKAEIGAENVVILPDYRKVADTDCLCPVDIAASAKKAGRVARRTEWAMEWVMERG